MTRTATCACGQLTAACEGEPVRISMCHCLDCQRRTGSTFGVQARFPKDAVTVAGRAHEYSRIGDSGGVGTMRFCPECGSTVYWEANTIPDFVTVAVGAFADPKFPPPRVSVYEERKHGWAATPDNIEHIE